MSYLNYLSPRWRILYLIFTHKADTISAIETYFTHQEQPLLLSQLNTLIMENILKNDHDHYLLIQYGNEPFLRVFAFISIMNPPLTRTEIRTHLKHKQLNTILEELIRARVIYEYRNELSKKTYILITDQKEPMIALLNATLLQTLKTSTQTYDQSHYSMLQNQQSILRYTESAIDPLIFNANEKRLLINLYHDLAIKKSRKIGRTEEYIVTQIFNGNASLAKKIILSLIGKKCIKCSCKHYYYLNNTIISEIKPFYDQHKKWIVIDEWLI